MKQIILNGKISDYVIFPDGVIKSSSGEVVVPVNDVLILRNNDGYHAFSYKHFCNTYSVCIGDSDGVEAVSATLTGVENTVPEVVEEKSVAVKSSIRKKK